MSLFAHFAHLEEPISVKEGEWVHFGQQLGRVGSTGNSTADHLHFEVLRFKPESWRRYTGGKNYAEVRSEYVDPQLFIKQLPDGKWVPAEDDKSRRGYQFMQYVKDGNYFHPGIDINSLADFGEIVYSPVEGRVACVEDTNWVQNWTKGWFKSDWNGGWGRHIWVEVDSSWLFNSKIKV